MSATAIAASGEPPTQVLAGVLDVRVAPGPTVARWLVGQGAGLAATASGMPPLDGVATGFGQGCVRVLTAGDVTVVGVFDLLVGRADDALEAVDLRP